MDKFPNFPKCVGCGYCCIEFPCSAAWLDGAITNEDYAVGKFCGLLFWNGEKYRCQKVIDDPKFAKGMAAGEGCPSDFMNDWRKDVKERG